MTSFVRDRVKELLSSLVVDCDSGKIKVTNVSDIEGEAQIVFARGKKKHIFDFNVTMDVEIKYSERSLKLTAKLVDISPANNFEWFISFKKKYDDLSESLDNHVKMLKDATHRKVQEFIDEYKQM